MIIYLNIIFSYLLFSTYCVYQDSYDNKNVIVLYKKAYKNVLFNLFVVTYIVLYITTKLVIHRQFNIFYSIRDFIISMYFSQIIFYIIHRCFHTKYLYKFHKVHHEYKRPLGFTAAYAHPIDYIFGNMIPLGVMPFILGSDIYTTNLFISVVLYNTIIVDHTYQKEYKHHQLHHKYFKYNYGSSNLDKMCNTYIDSKFSIKD